jgi:hypothetical protein
MTNVYSLPGQKTIEQAVCEEWGVTMEQLRSKSNKKPLPDARKVIMFFHKEYNKFSYKVAGAAVNRDHATAMDGYKKYFVFIEVDAEFREKAERAISQANPKYVKISLESQIEAKSKESALNFGRFLMRSMAFLMDGKEYPLFREEKIDDLIAEKFETYNIKINDQRQSKENVQKTAV